jgi:hypothetical protein
MPIVSDNVSSARENDLYWRTGCLPLVAGVQGTVGAVRGRVWLHGVTGASAVPRSTAHHVAIAAVLACRQRASGAASIRTL